jgi:DNA-directed RNA polymerase subunit E'/Rpb7
VIYKVKFKALVFRPFRGEVLDGVVSEVSNNGIIIESGPLHSFISTLVILSIISNYLISYTPYREWKRISNMTKLTILMCQEMMPITK